MARLAIPPVLNGNIDSVSPDGVVAGWCWSPDEPNARRTVSLAIDGAAIAETVASERRDDLAAAGLGDGAHGFTIRLAAGEIPDHSATVLTLRDVATGQLVGSELPFTWPRKRSAAADLVGNIERASEDGWISGWAWCPSQPERRRTLDILVDGVSVGRTRAYEYRQDLEQADVGDGRYGFSFALPWSAIANKGEMQLAIRDTDTGQDFGDPVTMRIGRMLDVEERIQGLERQVRMLQARLIEQADAEAASREARPARELFRTVAAFFHDLSEAPNSPHPAAATLRHAVGSVLDSHAPVVFAIPEQPAATLLLLGHGPRGSVYDGLAALQQHGIDRLADIVLLDDLRHGADVALLPAIVRNLRYVRLQPGIDPVAPRNDVAAGARGDIFVVLSSQLRPAPEAVAALLRALSDQPDIGLAGACVLRADGTIEHAGLNVSAQNELVEHAAAEDPERPDLKAPRSVDAVADLFFAVRRADLLAAGGFPAGYDDPGAAVAALCAGLRIRGREISIRPLARATLMEGGFRPPSPSAEDRRRLRALNAAPPPPPPPPPPPKQTGRPKRR